MCSLWPQAVFGFNAARPWGPPLAGSHVLCLGPGAAVWALLAVGAGCRHASVVCTSQVGYWAARALVAHNGYMMAEHGSAAPVCEARITVVPVGLHACRCDPASSAWIGPTSGAHGLDQQPSAPVPPAPGSTSTSSVSPSSRAASEGSSKVSKEPVHATDDLQCTHDGGTLGRGPFSEGGGVNELFVLPAGPAQVVVTDSLDHTCEKGALLDHVAQSGWFLSPIASPAFSPRS
jgi:hypothetical protein